MAGMFRCLEVSFIVSNAEKNKIMDGGATCHTENANEEKIREKVKGMCGKDAWTGNS